MTEQRYTPEEYSRLEKAAKQANRSETLIFLLVLCAFVKFTHARKAWHAMAEQDMQTALAIFSEGRGGVLPTLFALGAVMLPILVYVAWLFATVRTTRASDALYDGPAPGTAVLHHLLPPFFFIAPYQIMLKLYRSFARARQTMNDGAGVFAASLWWGTLWLAIILEVFRQIGVSDGIANPAFFQLSFAVSILGAICALSLAWLVWQVSRALR